MNNIRTIVVRFDGNKAKEGLQILSEANNPHISVADTMESAAKESAQLASKKEGAR